MVFYFRMATGEKALQVTKDLSAWTAVKNDFRYRWLSARQSWHGHSTPTLIKDWKPVRDYAPEWVHWLPTLAICGASFSLLGKMSIHLSRNPTARLIPTAVITTIGWSATKDFIRFVRPEFA